MDEKLNVAKRIIRKKKSKDASLATVSVRVGTLAEATAAAAAGLRTNFWIPYAQMLRDIRQQKTLADFFS